MFIALMTAANSPTWFECVSPGTLIAAFWVSLGPIQILLSQRASSFLLLKQAPSVKIVILGCVCILRCRCKGSSALGSRFRTFQPRHAFTSYLGRHRLARPFLSTSSHLVPSLSFFLSSILTLPLLPPVRMYVLSSLVGRPPIVYAIPILGRHHSEAS